MIAEIAADDFRAGAPAPADELRRVAEACDAADGVSTLNEQACLELNHRGIEGARLWVERDDAGAFSGFALLRDGELDLAVHPDARGRGVGAALLAEVAAAGPGTALGAWSHADHPGARALAARFGLELTRELVVMRRGLTDLPPRPASADGVRVRGFRPADEERVLEVNRSAFAHHPEQGDLSADDFGWRTRQPWFDPEGLLVAVEPDADGHERIVGFHWTKVHRDEDPAFGEVYVVAVDPRQAGRGLGSLLLVAGLEHLARSGVDDVLLYVERDNDPAVAVYTKFGFGVDRVESRFEGVPRPTAPPRP